MNALVPRIPRRLCLLPVLLALSAQGVLAATITVGSTADPGAAGDGLCTLRGAIANANTDSDTTGGDCAPGNGADGIVFGGAAFSTAQGGTIVLGVDQGAFMVAAELTVDGDNPEPNDSSARISIDANAASRIFEIQASAPTTLRNLFLADGDAVSADGGCISTQSALALNSVVMRDCHATRGGGVFVSATGALTMVNSTVDASSAEQGGAIFGSGGGVTIDLSTFQSNAASAAGGAIALVDGATATVTRSTFTGNGADEGGVLTPKGGALYADGAGLVAISLSSLSGNQAAEAGGAIWLRNTEARLGALDLRDNSVSNGGGGGIYLGGSGPVTVDNSRLLDNHASCETVDAGANCVDPAGAGGAIRNDGGTLIVRGSLVSGNTAARAGAGVHTGAGGSTTLVEVVVGGDDAADGNMTGTQPGHGGGLQVENGTLTVTSSTIAFNTASQGGGIWAGDLATVEVVSSTISSNLATGGGDGAGADGGGVYQQAGGSTTLRFTTVASNHADGNGGGLAVGSGATQSIIVESSIVAQNSAGGADDDFVDGAGIATANSVVRTADAGMQGLQLFGGPTATHPLTATSGALDIGAQSACVNAPVSALDQRGAARPIDAPDTDGDNDPATLCDAGSFERTPELAHLAVSATAQYELDAQPGEDLVVLGFGLRNSGATGVTVSGFRTRPFFNAGFDFLTGLLPSTFDPAEPLVFEVVIDRDGDGRLDQEDTEVVGEDVANQGIGFTFNGGLQIQPDEQTNLLVVVRIQGAEPVAMAARPPTAWYAGGMLLALIGVFGLRGVRWPTRGLLAVLVVVLGLVACSKGDDPPPPDFLFFPGDPTLLGLLRYQLNSVAGSGGQVIVGEGLPVYGPVIVD